MLAAISDWILSLHGWVAIGIVFLFPALESSAFVGFVFPGEISVILGGVLSSNGHVRLPAVIVAAVVGAILGDTIGYAVGRRWGHQILRGVGRRVPFIRHRIDEHLESARAYLKRRGGAAVFFGRFTAALRVLVPGLAGMAEMPYGEFVFWNASGGAIWGTTFALLGYFAGEAWHRAAGAASEAGLALLILILLGLVGGRILRNLRKKGEPVPDRLARTKPVAWIRSRFPRQSAWLARRADPRSPRGYALSAVVLAGAVCCWIFGALTQDVFAHDEAVLSDPRVMRFVVERRAAWVTTFMNGATWLGSNGLLIPLAVLLCVCLLIRRRGWRQVALPAAALAGADVWYEIVKPLVGRARPPVAVHLAPASGPSFPSGHATVAIAVWGVVALVLSTGLGWRWKVVIWSVAVVIVTLVAFSRVYLGVHWWTDVAGGLGLGGAWLCLLVAAALMSGPRAAAG